MKTKQITVTAPDWIPTDYGRRVTVTWKTLKFKLRPYRCIDCNCSLDHKSPEYTYSAIGKRRVILQCSLHMLHLGPRLGICGKCLSKRIESLFGRLGPLDYSDPNHIDGTITHKCDACLEVKTTISISRDPECDIRFGSSWWNGHHMCQECLREAAELGTPRSGIGYHLGCHRYSINQAGAAIGLDHWWRLLLPRQ